MENVPCTMVGHWGEAEQLWIPTITVPSILHPRPPLGRRDRPRPLSLEPAKTVSSRIRCQCLTTEGAAKRAGGAGVLARPPGNGFLKGPSVIEWRPTGEVDASGRRQGSESQIARGVIP